MLGSSYTPQTPYIERREAQGLFAQLLDQKSSYRVLNIYGRSGRGKSRLMSYLSKRYLEDSSDTIHLTIDFEDRLLHKPMSAIMHIAKAIESKYDVNFITLWKAYAQLWKKRYEHSPILYAADLPYYQEIQELIKPKKRSGVLTIAKDLFGTKLAKELELLQKMDTKDIETKLYQFFAADLRNIIKSQKFKDAVLIFENLDTLQEYNHATPCAKDAWIRDLITYLGKDVLVAITSCEALEWQKCNSTWRSVVNSSELAIFTKKEALRYLTLAGIKEKSIQDAIVLNAGGEPFILDLARIAYKEREMRAPVVKQDIFDAFFATVDEQLLRLLKVLAYTRFFSKELILQLVRQFAIGLDKNSIEKLLGYHFVKRIGVNKYALDNRLKDIIVAREVEVERIEYRAFLFSYYENILQRLDEKRVKSRPHLVDEAIEEAWYYLNLINSEPLVHFEWLDYYIDKFFMYAAWEPFLDRYHLIVPKLEKAKDATSQFKLINLYNNLAGLYESLGDTKQSKEYYNRVVKLSRPIALSA
ncbi:MAG TPA: hypothetical protein ENK74_01175 [Nitratifractor sp.]|nr:hypothetical protein [Nitratifractor sp.]